MAVIAGVIWEEEVLGVGSIPEEVGVAIPSVEGVDVDGAVVAGLLGWAVNTAEMVW